MTAVVVYDEAYDLHLPGWEWCLPFEPSKYGRIMESLRRSGALAKVCLARPSPLTTEQLALAHDDSYLPLLSHPRVFASVFENDLLAHIPSRDLHAGLVSPLLLAAGGTLTAARAALAVGTAFNMGGGFHHAARKHGSGFCLVADVAIAALVLLSDGDVRSVLIVDTDAHQGNGTADVLRGVAGTFTLSLHQHGIFPMPKARSDLDVPFESGITDDEYLDLLGQHLPRALAEARPDLVIHVAGTDTLAGDPLTDCAMTAGGIARRDEFVWRLARDAGAAYAMVLAGGYSPGSPSAHAASIANVIGLSDGSSTRR